MGKCQKIAHQFSGTVQRSKHGHNLEVGQKHFENGWNK